MAFEELKAKHSVVWGAGPYQRVTDALIEAHEHLFSVCEPESGENWLDVATGTGNIAIRAAEGGATVTAQDIAPELVAAAADRANAAGVEIDFRTGDCEDMPFADGEFDTVTSSFGHMFSPDHATSANEIARVCRTGGRIALLTWHPSEGVADLFKILSQYQQTPAGAGRPFDWGDTEHVNDLLGECFNLGYARGISVHREPSGEALWRVFREDYGPTKVLADSLDDEQYAQLERECIEYFETFRAPGGGVEWAREYLLTVGTRTRVPVGETSLAQASA
ncbi:MAG: class I SAM-dependent methyltransferase [Thermoleophilaceae bacterium]|nr:class I SAM-dependent methyltransferase [Thermoleophilaceae bacterium]